MPSDSSNSGRADVGSDPETGVSICAFTTDAIAINADAIAINAAKHADEEPNRT